MFEQAMDDDVPIRDHPEALGRLADAFARRRIAMGADADGRLVLVRPAELLVEHGDDAAFDTALKELTARDDGLARRVSEAQPVAGALVRVVLEAERPAELAGDDSRWSTRSVGTALRTLRDAGFAALPNYVLLGSQGIIGNPVGAEAHVVGGMLFTARTVETPGGVVLRTTSDPATRPAFLRPPLDLDARRPKVLVLDTGLRTVDGKGGHAEHGELQRIEIPPDWIIDPNPLAIDDEDEQDDDGLGYLDFEAGHGTFIAGIVRQICPDAEIHIAGVLSSFGDGDVASLLTRLELAVQRAGPFDLVVMSVGGYMSDADAQAFGRALMPLLGDGLGIAAAGNQASSRRYFPAALPGIVAVGALCDAGRAWFSNFGGWVDACAPGVDVVSTFFVEARDQDGPPYEGWARWSGTSFSAPKVAGAIAQEMYLTGASAATAWNRLSDYQRYRYPDLGTVFNL